MELVLSLLVIQGVMGAFDNLWHHEITEALPSKPSARTELALHTTREFLYAVIFLALAWSEWHGVFAWTLAAMLLTEVVVTLWDFIEEDLTRKLPPLERVLHTLLAMNYGAVLVLLVPIIWGWAAAPGAIVPAGYGILSWIMTLYAVGVFAWSVRDGIAVVKLNRLRQPEWQRRPFVVAELAAPKTVLVTGATGFIGGHLCRRLVERGDKVIVLARDAKSAEYRFGPHARIIENLDDVTAETTVDAVVNFAGAPVLGLPWTRARRREIMQSRIGTTEDLLSLMSRLEAPPEVLVNASAIGFYGRSGDALCDETHPPQEIFMSELCRRWEETAWQAHSLGVRVCLMRLGLVLGTDGGPLPALVQPARFGLGAVIGSGRQWISWVHIHDVTAFALRLIDGRDFSGPYNVTAPETVTHDRFMELLGRVLRRPVWLRIPAWPLKLVLGEMSDLLLEGQRTTSAKAESEGFRFRHPTLEVALADLLAGRPANVTVLHPASREPGPKGSVPPRRPV